jgi:hypothetical protein
VPPGASSPAGSVWARVSAGRRIGVVVERLTLEQRIRERVELRPILRQEGDDPGVRTLRALPVSTLVDCRVPHNPTVSRAVTHKGKKHSGTSAGTRCSGHVPPCGVTGRVWVFAVAGVLSTYDAISAEWHRFAAGDQTSSITTHCSAILASARRKVSTDSKRTCRPDGGTPMNSTRWVP